MKVSNQSTFVLVALCGQAVTFVLAVFLARQLSLANFQAYVVASTVFILLVMFAPRGAEKLAMRVLPPLLHRDDWEMARGYFRFGVRRTLRASTAAAIVAGIVTLLLPGINGPTRAAILVTCLSLPGGALAHYAVEVLSAAGEPLRALAIFKVAVPGAALLLAGSAVALLAHVSGAVATACWGLAWVAGLILFTRSTRTIVPKLFAGTSHEKLDAWRRATRPFFIHHVSMAVLGSLGVLVLDWLNPGIAAVGAYAAAMALAKPLSVLATSTNRAHSRQLSFLLETDDFAGLQAAQRRRFYRLAPVLLLFLFITFGWTSNLLALFRPEFVTEGVVPLRVLAATSAFTVMLSLAPTYLKFRERNLLTYVTAPSAAIAQLLLLIVLVPRFGATGAAVAYGLSMCGMYGSYALLAHREISCYKASAVDGRFPANKGTKQRLLL